MQFRKHNKLNKGQTFAEYCLILGLISIVLVAALTQWGNELNSTKNNLNNALNSVNQNIGSSVST